MLKFAISLWHLKKEVRNEIRDLTALVDANATLTHCYTSNVLSPLMLFLPQYGIHSKPLLHFINCLCNISSLLFQVMVGSCKLVCWWKNWATYQCFWSGFCNCMHTSAHMSLVWFVERSSMHHFCWWHTFSVIFLNFK